MSAASDDAGITGGETFLDWARRMGFEVLQTADPGRTVLCDLCNADYTDRPETGGFLFQSKAVCPGCAPCFEARVRACGEEQFIRARCLPGMAFADWVRQALR